MIATILTVGSKKGGEVEGRESAIREGMEDKEKKRNLKNKIGYVFH